jgi:tetratricopeptide (TPR) repeat protein
MKPTDYAYDYNFRGEAYNYLGDQKAALEAYKQAKHIDPKFKYTYLYLGNTYKELNEKEQSIDNYNKYLELGGNKEDDAEEVRSYITQMGFKPKY